MVEIDNLHQDEKKRKGKSMSQETQEKNDQQTQAPAKQELSLLDCLRDLAGYQKTISSIEASPETENQEPLALYHHHPVIKKILAMSEKLHGWITEFEDRLVELEEDFDFEDAPVVQQEIDYSQLPTLLPGNAGVVLSLGDIDIMFKLLTAVFSHEDVPKDIRQLSFRMASELLAKIDNCTVEEASNKILNPGA